MRLPVAKSSRFLCGGDGVPAAQGLHWREGWVEEAQIDPIPYLGLQDPVASLTHVAGALAFAALGFRLIARPCGCRLSTAALAVYVLGVVGTLLASGLMHMSTRESGLREALVRVDHAAIFFLIAATFTPVHVIEFRRWPRWGVLLVIWCAAAAGIALKLLYFDAIPEWLSLSLYLALGWTGLFSAWLLYGQSGLAPLLRGLPQCLHLIGQCRQLQHAPRQ